MHRLALGCVVALLAVPAMAAQTRVRVTGVLAAPTGSLTGIPLAAGDRFSATFYLNLPEGSAAIAPLGGTGVGQAYYNTLPRVDIMLLTAGGNYAMNLRPGFKGSSVVYDNGTSAAGPLVDYSGISIGAVVVGGPTILPLLTTDLALPANAFPAFFSFGRFAVAPPGSPPGALPGLLTSTALPDYADFFGAPGALYTGNLTFRAGTITNPAQFSSLPSSNFAFNALQVTVLPEPGSWALLIAGFAAVGAAQRRVRVSRAV